MKSGLVRVPYLMDWGPECPGFCGSHRLEGPRYGILLEDSGSGRLPKRPEFYFFHMPFLVTFFVFTNSFYNVTTKLQSTWQRAPREMYKRYFRDSLFTCNFSVY